MYLNIEWMEYNPDTGEIDGKGGAYTDIKNLSFAPQTDLTGNSLPINEYTVDVVTTDDIPTTTVTHELYDDMDQLWANWPIVKVIRISPDVVRVTARSWLDKLDHRQMESEVFTATSAADAIADCFGDDTDDYQISVALQFATLTGFVPEQTARERLQWILLAIGAYVRDVYTEEAYILPVDETEALIPLDRTFMRPSLDLSEVVTAVKVTSYTFSQAASEAEWQANDSSYMFPLPWIATEQSVTLANPDASEDDPENVKELDGVYLINSGNVSAITSRLAKYWFNRQTVSLDCINNRQYRPGDKVVGYTAEDALVVGYIQQASFGFGKQARSQLKLIGVDNVTGAKLTVNYTHNGGRIGQAVYYFPVGYTYSIANPYIDRTFEGRRFVYAPDDATITGTMTSGDNTATQTYSVALEYYDKKLSVYSADSVTLQSGSGTSTGVIS